METGYNGEEALHKLKQFREAGGPGLLCAFLDVDSARPEP